MDINKVFKNIDATEFMRQKEWLQNQIASLEPSGSDATRFPEGILHMMDQIQNRIKKEIDCSDLEITHVLNLSTAHITEYTSERLLQAAMDEYVLPACTVYKKSEYGFYIYIDFDDEIEKMPKDLLKCVRVAKNEGCTCLCLDRDAPVTKLLPIYEW